MRRWEAGRCFSTTGDPRWPFWVLVASGLALLVAMSWVGH